MESQCCTEQSKGRLLQTKVLERKIELEKANTFSKTTNGDVHRGAMDINTTKKQDAVQERFEDAAVNAKSLKGGLIDNQYPCQPPRLHCRDLRR